MSLTTNFAGSPYYDDFDATKKYLRLLFKPSYAVQARELTQIQSLLQNQVKSFGEHIFKNGSIVSGGQFFLQESTYLKLTPTYSGSDISYLNFVGKTITSLDETKRAEVIVVYDQTDTDPITLLVKQLYGEPFTSLETIKTKEISPFYATILTDGVGVGQIFSVDSGIYFYDGYFINSDSQTIAISKYSSNANSRVGFELTESIVDNNQDSSLLDPAQDASNYQAPGSDRYKIDLILSSRSLTSEDDEKFIELVQIQNGIITKENRYPIYSVLEETLARRTYDESGNYTTKAFKISLDTNSSNTAQTNITLSPGKAYVYGYEFETVGPTTIVVDKPRSTTEIQNKRLTSDYGNYVYTTNHLGAFKINDLNTIDVHCVNSASINTSTTGTISNTKIGTVRVKSIAFESSSNTSDSSTYVYRTYIFDTNIGSITGSLNVQDSTSDVANNRTIHYLPAGFNNILNNCYAGAKFRITSGPGSNETLPKLILGGPTKPGSQVEIYTDGLYTILPNTSSKFSIDFEFKDAESFATFSGTTKQISSDIDTRSKDLISTYNDTIILESSYEPLIFPLGENYIAANTISDMSLSYKKAFTGQNFSSSSTDLSSSLGSFETIAGASTNSSKQQNYFIAVTTKNSSSYDVGDIIPADKITVDEINGTITVDSANDMIATVIATVDVSSISPKIKTYYSANTTIQTSLGTNIFGGGNTAIVSYSTKGQIHITSSFVNKIPGEAQSLYVSDVTEIVAVKDFNGLGISQANLASAIDITSSYTLDNGQKDSYYDHSSAILKFGSSSPVGPIVIFYNRLYSSGAGFFSVDSYDNIGYENIPSYSSKLHNTTYNLRDCLDFRPVRTDHSLSLTFDSIAAKIPENGSDILLDYEYYLGRIDKVVLDKSKSFDIIKGVPSLNPVVPNDSSTGMTLFILTYPPYTLSTNEIDVKYLEHKRYTMRDIGGIEKRVQNLEYYTSLSLLEQETLNKQDLTTLDSQNLQRFKNGIIVDSFVGHSVADITNEDYFAAIDRVNNELRPRFNISAHKLNFDSANSSNYSQTGSLVSLNYTSTPFIEQAKASKAINVNPFNVVNYLGKISLYPTSDIWIDTDKKPDVLVNLGGDNDAWDLITEDFVSYEWGDWNTVWTGVDVDVESTTRRRFWWDIFGLFGRNRTTTTTTTVTEQQVRTGIVTSVVPETITESIGTNVIDVSIIPYMRESNILFVGNSFKPSTTIYPFFDNINIESNVSNRINKFYVSNNNIQFSINLSNPEIVEIKNKDTSTVLGTGLVVHTSNNIVYVSNIDATSSFDVANCEIYGVQSSATYDVTIYEHFGGTVSASDVNTITLATNALGANNLTSGITGKVYIVQGIGAGQTRNISSYDSNTGILTVTPNWTTVPVAGESEYAIGSLQTDASGSVVGVFTVPSGTFRVGEKLFRLMDSSVGDLETCSTSGDASFFAQGLLKTVQETFVSTIQPTIQRNEVTEERVVSSTTTNTTTNTIRRWIDPVAQTFLVSPIQYPEGLFLNKVRVCFKSKDDVIPITLQIRPSVNGYPSSSVIYPFASVTLTPDKINITSTPSLDDTDSDKYTEFVFDSPVFLSPEEHSIVLIANSNKYEIYVAEIGKTDITTNRLISEQPYGGSFFASQNASTWTADQSTDLMFKMFRNSYVSSSGTAQFLVDSPENSVAYSLIQVITSDIILAKTLLNYQYKSEKLSGGFTDFSNIIPGRDYELIDASGLKVLSNTTGPQTFVLQGIMQSTDNIVSPIIDVARTGLLTVENIINNLELSNTGFIIENTGSGYANTDDVVITISGGGGSGAIAKANVVSGIIDRIYLTSNGSGYYYNPTISIVGTNSGSGAIARYVGETSPKGGNATAKYICRKVNLAEGFNSGDLRVYITTYKPVGTKIYVYYKILSESDNETFESKNWQLMTELGNANYTSVNASDYRELTFAPGSNGIPDNSVVYTTTNSSYTSFKTFAIKIVMSSNNPTIVPKIRDFRAIALPAG